jgi:stalled ribosome rescue protein Dom34
MSTNPNKWKIAFVVLAVAAFCVVAYLAIQLFDQSATLGMVSDAFQRREDALSLLRRSIPDMLRTDHLSQQDIFTILKKHNQGKPIVTGPGFIEMDQMRFCFATNGTLERVEKTDDYGTRASDTPTNRPAIP